MNETCDAQYGKNPDLCYRAKGHKGAHWNRYGTTWATEQQWESVEEWLR